MSKLHLIDVELKDTRFYQEVFAEGREEGREKGRKEGHEEGREDEARAAVLRLLRRRFGELPPGQVERIGQLPLAQAQALSEDLLDFQSLAALSDWLARQGGAVQ